MTTPLVDEALHQQLALARIFSGHDGPGYMRLMIGDKAADPVSFERHIRQAASEQAEALLTATTYAVTADMVEVIKHGVESIKAEDIPNTFDMMLPSDSGFVWLQRPHIFPTVPPDIIVNDLMHNASEREVCGLWWQRGRVRIRDRVDGHFRVVPGIQAGVCCTRIAAMQAAVDGHLYTEADLIEWGLAPVLPFDLTAWAENIGWVEITQEEWDAGGRDRPGEVHPSGAYWRRWLTCFWTLANDHVVTTMASRPVRRRAERAGMVAAPDYGDVRVITLRKQTVMPDGHVPQEVEVAWSHRWMVNGHWRWQAHGKGRALRRLIWIAPFVKGPDDKPLIIKDDVRVLKR